MTTAAIGPFAYIVAPTKSGVWGLRLTHRLISRPEFSPQDLMRELGPDPLTIVIANDGCTWRHINDIGKAEGILPPWWNQSYKGKDAHTIAFVNRAFEGAEHTDIAGHLDSLEARYRRALRLDPRVAA